MPGTETALFTAICLVGLFATWRFTEGPLRAFTLGAMALTLAIGLGRASTQALAKQSEPVALRPADSGATGSGACRSCHPSEHDSWHRSFHRTMTEIASPSSVRGPWDGVRVEADGRSVELSRRGAEYWIRLPDPDLVATLLHAGVREPTRTAPLVSRRVLLTTGSHHHQAYWVKGERGNELRLAPITYLIAEGRYVSRHDAFLQPPDAPAHATRWNSNCIQCHATRGEPRLDEHADVFTTSAAELGIACEACHGPGGAHVAKQQNPVTRFASHLSGAPDPSIVNPKRLSSARASEVCGQCHAYFVPRDEASFWTRGYDYRPGDALDGSRALLEPRSTERGLVEAAAESLFWGDGTIRVGGRELNALRASACFTRGAGEHQLSCLSCHSLHDSEPNDQLRHGDALDAPCIHCHRAEASAGSSHSHHAPGSPGASCVSCHMPFTSYALFTAIRSHRIDSPNAFVTAETGRPNACNLCHLDRTLGWTAAALRTWYGTKPSAALSDTATSALESGTARAVEELLAGDAATRAVVAAAFGRDEALAASGNAWEARVLAELVDDRYAAVRHVALASLRALPGFGDFRADFVAAPDERRAARKAALERDAALAVSRRDSALPLDTRGQRDEARIEALLRARDQHPTTISE
ncbi:MAG TPA: multiheme c-type cytochrome [Polyangiaceae bacterium]|nr:multiheme c-type cytochrome [Polyangiaceae bacterium]